MQFRLSEIVLPPGRASASATSDLRDVGSLSSEWPWKPGRTPSRCEEALLGEIAT